MWIHWKLGYLKLWRPVNSTLPYVSIHKFSRHSQKTNKCFRENSRKVSSWLSLSTVNFHGRYNLRLRNDNTASHKHPLSTATYQEHNADTIPLINHIFITTFLIYFASLSEAIRLFMFTWKITSQKTLQLNIAVAPKSTTGNQGVAVHFVWSLTGPNSVQ